MSCHDIAAVVQLLFQKSIEWSHKHQFFVGVGVVKNAFDNLRLELACRGVEAAGHHPAITAALCLENSGLIIKSNFEGIDTTCKLNKSFGQGRMESNKLWRYSLNLVID